MDSRSVSFFTVMSLLILQVSTFNIRDDRNSTASKDSGSTANAASNASDADSLDDRFNLNFNVAQAQGVGRYGGQSLANSLSYGVNAGIRTAGGQYQNLYSNSGSHSNGFSTGPGAPLTFANTGSRLVPGHAGGNAGAGVFGGRGSSFAQSQNQNLEIPIDNYGTVLLSNLKPPSDSSKDQASKPDSQKTDPAPLSF